MLPLIGKILLKLGFGYKSLASKTTGNVLLGKKTVIASGAILDASKPGMITLSDDCHVYHGAILASYGGKISVGHRTRINPYCILYGHGGLSIGNDCLIATGCVFIPGNHNINQIDAPINAQGLTCVGITVEDDVWFGAKVTILDGVTIGRGSVIGAGAVVTRSIPPYSIAVGVPAKIIGSRTKV